MVWRLFSSHESIFLGNMTLVPVQFCIREYPDRYENLHFWWKIHPIKGCCAVTLNIPMWVPCEGLFSLNIYQNSLYAAKLIRVRGYLPETVGGRCRCLRNFFTAGYVSSEQTYMMSIIASICAPSLKPTILKYNRGLSSNGQYPLVCWYFFTLCWYFFTFFAFITFYTRVLFVIYSVLLLFCCWVRKVVPDFPNLPSMYLILLDRVWSSSCNWILSTCMAAGIYHPLRGSCQDWYIIQCLEPQPGSLIFSFLNTRIWALL